MIEHLAVDVDWSSAVIITVTNYDNWQIYMIIVRWEYEYKKLVYKEVAYKIRLSAPEGYNYLAIQGTAFKS